MKNKLRYSLQALGFLVLVGCSSGEQAEQDQQTNSSDLASPQLAGTDAIVASPEPVLVESEPAASAVENVETVPSPASAKAKETATAAIPAIEPKPDPVVASQAKPSIPASPPTSYAMCASCHTADEGGADRLGPNLFGVMGKQAGQGSFAFSDALRNSGLTWDDATMDRWLANPRQVVPGNRMSFPGVRDARKRREIIEYLKKQR